MKAESKIPQEETLKFPNGLLDFLNAALEGRETVTPKAFSGFADLPVPGRMGVPDDAGPDWWQSRARLRQDPGDWNILYPEFEFGPDEVETAEEFGSDLIIVGSHGYSRWERLLLGSVSQSVVHHAPCSVLVVREPVE